MNKSKDEAPITGTAPLPPNVPLAPAHIHALSRSRSAVLSFLALSFGPDGALRAGSKTLKSASGSLVLPEGSYYLTQDIPAGAELEIRGDVSLCLNGKILERQIQVPVGATLSLCDCRGKGRICSAGAMGVSGRLVMYGGCIENACNVRSPSRCAVVLHGPTSSAELYGGTIKAPAGYGIFADELSSRLILSGSPRFEGCRADISAQQLRLFPDCVFPNGRLKLSCRMPLAPGSFLPLSGAVEKDYSHMFTVLERGHYTSCMRDNSLILCAAGITHQPTPEDPRLTVLPSEHVSYQWRRATVTDVTAGREFSPQSDGGGHMSTISLLSGDTVFFAPEPSAAESDVIGLLNINSGQHVVAQLNGGIACAHIVSDGCYAFVNLSAYFGMELDGESERMRDVFINPSKLSVQSIVLGHQLAGQFTPVLMPLGPGYYLCRVTWPDGYTVDSLPVRIK